MNMSTNRDVTTEEICKEDNLMIYLKVLSQYYSSIDLPKITIDSDKLTDPSELKATLMRMIDNSYILMKRYQKLQQRLSQLQSINTKSQKDCQSLKGANCSLEREKDQLESEIKLLKEKNKLIRYEHEQQNDTNRQLQQKILKAQNENKSQGKLLHHKISKRDADNAELHKKLEKNCGLYIGVDTCIAKKLETYYKNEEKYKDTILALQHSNSELLDEVLNLKQELFMRDIRDCKM